MALTPNAPDDALERRLLASSTRSGPDPLRWLGMSQRAARAITSGDPLISLGPTPATARDLTHSPDALDHLRLACLTAGRLDRTDTAAALARSGVLREAAAAAERLEHRTGGAPVITGRTARAVRVFLAHRVRDHLGLAYRSADATSAR